MLVLTSADKIQVSLLNAIAASQMSCFASYRDTTTNAITPLRNAASTNNTSQVDLVDSPAASTQRIVDYLSVYNTDTTSDTITLQLDVSGTPYTLTVATLLPGEKLEYQEGVGFRSLGIYGELKTGNELGHNNISGLNSVVLSSDVVNSNAVANTIADITGLSFSVTSGKTYWFRFIIPYTSAATGTGARFSINGPATTALYYESYYNVQAGANNVTINAGLVAYDNPAAANASSNLTGNLATVEGIAIFSANGTLIGRFASEVSNSAITAKAGAIVYYKQLD